MVAKDDTLTTEALVDEALELGAQLGRPLRYVQINSFYNGSTGSIMKSLHRDLFEKGVDSYIFWGRRHETINDHEQCCATKLGYLSHGAKTRLFDRMGFYSKRDTAKLLAKLDEIDPDVVHLHNIHGYYVNIEMLFGWLTSHRCQVRWTLHDCWAFTGHCAHFTYVKCAQWQSHCAYGKPCPQLDTYPKTISKQSCARNFEDKKRIFNLVPPDRMKLITPSHWLEGLVKQSFLSKYPVEVRHNTIDKTVFRPSPSDFRERYGIGDRFMILGVASPWTERKGLGDFLRLAEELDNEKYAIVLVGLSDKQIKQVSKRSANLIKTDPASKHAELRLLAHDFIDFSAGGESGLMDGKEPVAMIREFTCEKVIELDNWVDAVDMDSLKATVVRFSKGGIAVLVRKTESKEQLAAIYTAANVFFNPTTEDNYPTVNLEAEACATPVYTYDTGGCAETLSRHDSKVIGK